MRTTMLIHIVAGSLGLISGFVALYAAKGAPLHRRAGRVFVSVMLTMTLTGITIAAVRGVAPAINIPAGLLTAYLVVTGLTTLRPLAAGPRWLDLGAMLVGLAIGMISLAFGLDALANGGEKDGMPAFPFLMFGVVGMLASVGDLRMLLAGTLSGRSRLTRHLWRMSFALFIAALSFFLGQSDELPRAFRILPLLALPPVAVLVTLLYWVWRVRVRRGSRGSVGAGAPQEPPLSALREAELA